MREWKFRATGTLMRADNPLPHPPYGHPVSSTGRALLPEGEGKLPHHGCTTVIEAGIDLPTPRISGRYMSSTSGGGTL